MTPAERTNLEALDAAPDKTLSWRELRDASGCRSSAGFRRVTFRMLGRLIARADEKGLDMVITFGGLTALRDAVSK